MYANVARSSLDPKIKELICNPNLIYYLRVSDRSSSVALPGATAYPAVRITAFFWERQMSWFIYEVPEYNEDGARIEPFSDLRSRVMKVSGQAMADELESVRENAAATANTPTHPLRAAENPHVFPIPYADSMILVGFIFELTRESRQLVVSPVEMPWLKGA
jgi:hypothetical protein